MSYMDRALKARDPRYARILERLGYERRDMVAGDEPAATRQAESGQDETAKLREEYEAVVGKRPFMGWDAEKLRQKISEAQAE